jgi:Na+/proline symporter
VIYTIVGFVWAGIGGTFSVVILLTFFWKRYHGKAVLCTIVGGLLFTVVWQGAGMEPVLSARVATFAFSMLTAVVATVALRRVRTA